MIWEGNLFCKNRVVNNLLCNSSYIGRGKIDYRQSAGIIKANKLPIETHLQWRVYVNSPLPSKHDPYNWLQIELTKKMSNFKAMFCILCFLFRVIYLGVIAFIVLLAGVTGVFRSIGKEPERLVSVLGLIAMLGICFLCSKYPGKVSTPLKID